MGWDGWDGSPGGPRYRAPTVLKTSKSEIPKGRTMEWNEKHQSQKFGKSRAYYEPPPSSDIRTLYEIQIELFVSC